MQAQNLLVATRGMFTMTTKKGIRTLLTRKNLIGGALALGGMIVGAIVGIAVQVGVESTGMLGPGVESLLAEQETNFEELNSRLDTLQAATDDPELARELGEIVALLERQDELRQKANFELEFLGNQVASLREQSLAEHGFASGADFWLAVGESVSIGDRRHVIGLTRTWSTAADVVLNGERARLPVGGSISTDDCIVFLKQAIRSSDSRAGFDVTCGDDAA